jgi:hypothetical protein
MRGGPEWPGPLLEDRTMGINEACLRRVGERAEGA